MILYAVITVLSCLVQLSNVEGQQLEFMAKPEIVVVGQPFDITCKSTRKTHGYTIISGDGSSILKTARDYTNKILKDVFDDVDPKKHDSSKLKTHVTLTRRSSKITDTTKYLCTSYDFSDENALTKSVNISIGYKPGDVQMTLKDENGQSKFKRGSVITISCTSKMISKPGTITMTIADEPEKVTNGNTAEHILTVNQPELYNGKNVKCAAKNIFGSSSATKLLVIEYAPTQELIKANAGSETKFAVKPGTKIQCTAMGNPEPTMKWSKFDNKLFVLNGSDILVSKTDVKKVTTSTAECQVLQSGKVVTNKTFTITIDVPPTTTTVTTTTTTYTTTALVPSTIIVSTESITTTAAAAATKSSLKTLFYSSLMPLLISFIIC